MPTPNDPVAPQPTPPEGANPNDVTPAPAPKVRRRRRWPYVILALVLLLALLALLAPKIASTSAARSYVLGKVNDQLNGSVEVKDWSLSWTGGIDVSGVRVLDAEKRLVAEIAHVHTGLSLVDAMRGRYHCGTTVVDDANLAQLIIRPDGTTNLDDLTKKPAASNASPVKAEAPRADAAQPKSGSAPSTGGSALPDVSGDFTLNRPRGMVLDQRTQQTVFLDPASAVHVKITSLEAPIENAIAAVFRVGSNGAPGTVKLDGTAQVAKAGRIDVDNAAINETLTLAGVPLQSANAFLALAGQNLTMSGTANGAIAVTMAGANQLAVNGDVTASQFSATGEVLNGETFATSVLKIPVKLTRTVVNAQTTRLKIEALGVQADQITASVTGDVQQEALLRALANKAPGADGQLNAVVRVANLKGLSDQLPKTMHMLPGVKLETGSLYHEAELTLKAAGTVAHLQTDIQNVTGTRDGQRITLDPISQTADVTLPEISDLSVYVGSAFLTVEGGGKTLADVKLNGSVDLPALRKQVGQFVDFGKTELAGTGKFTITTKGDPAQAAAPIHANLDANFSNLKITGIEGQKPIDEPSLTANAGALLRRAADNGVSGVDELHADAKGSFFTLTVKNGKLQLAPERQGGKSPGLWEMVRSVDVDAQVQLPKAYDYVAAAGPREPMGMPLPIELAQAAPAPAEPEDPAAPRRARSGRTQAARRTDTPNTPVPTTAGATTPATGPATTQPLPPLKITDGVASLHLSLARDASKTLLKNSTLVVERLAFTRGAANYAAPKDHPRTVDLKIDGALETVAEQLRGITLTTLEGTLAGGALKLASPVNVSGLAGSEPMKATGEVSLAGKLTDVTTLLDALAAKQPGEAYPYAGDYAITQTLGTQGDVVSMAGSATVADFRVANAKDAAKPLLTEPKLALSNDVRYDSVKRSASVANLKLDMQGTDALHASLAGNVGDIGKRQTLENVKLSLAYDLEKLWPIVGPFLPDTQQDVRDAKVTGKFTREFSVTGAYPADRPFREAIKSVDAKGALAVATFEGMGASLANVDLKFTCANGRLTIQAPAIDANQGKVTLDGAFADLTEADPRITIPPGTKMILHVTINPVLGDTIGKYINPVLTNSKRADGLIELTVVKCEGVSLGEAMRGVNSGNAEVQFAINNLDVANPLGSLVVGSLLKGIGGGAGGDIVSGALGALTGNKNKGGDAKGGGGTALVPGEADTFNGDMTGTITLAAGQTHQDITLKLVDPSGATTRKASARTGGAQVAADQQQPEPMLLTFKGDIRLSDLQQNLDVRFPSPLLAKFVPEKNVARWITTAFPNGIPVTLKGHTNKPEVDAGAFLKEAGGAKLEQLLGGAAGGSKDGAKDGKEKPADVVGGLLDSLNKKKKEKKD